MAQQRYWFLENMMYVFCSHRMQQLEGSSQARRIPKGEKIIVSEQDNGKIFFLTKGRIKICSPGKSGKDNIEAILTCGEAFGLLPGTNEPNDEYAIALEDAHVFLLTPEVVHDLVIRHHPVTIFFMRLVGSKRLQMEERLPTLMFKNAKQRILECIAEKARSEGVQNGKSVEIPGFLTDRHLACITATSQQQVHTVMTELQKEGVITFRHRTLIVKNPARLTE